MKRICHIWKKDPQRKISYQQDPHHRGVHLDKISSFKDKPNGNKDLITKPPIKKRKRNLWNEENNTNTKARVRVYKEHNLQHREEVMRLENDVSYKKVIHSQNIYQYDEIILQYK